MKKDRGNAKRMKRVFLIIFCTMWRSLPLLFAQHQSDTEIRHHATEEHFGALTRNRLQIADSGLTVVGRWAWGPCQAVDVKGGYAFIGNGPTFQALDVSNPSSPKIVGEYLTESVVSDIRLRDSLAFIAGGKGLLILDTSVPSALRRVGEVSIGFGPIRTAVVDSFAFTTVFAGGLYVVDISDPTRPRLRGSIATGGQLPTGLAAKGRYVYVGNQEWPDLALIDASNPDTLQRSFVGIGGWGISAYVRDTLLFLGVAEYDGNQSMKIFDVGNPKFPVELGRVGVGFTRSYEINSITVQGNFAFAAIEGHGIDAIDISDVAHPHIADSLFSDTLASSPGYSISLLEGEVYGTFNSGLWVVDASRPDSLTERSFFLAGGNGPLGIALDSQFAYLAVGSAGLAVVDLSNPAIPIRIGAIRLHGTSTTVATVGNYAYVGTDCGISVVNISNRCYPQRTTELAIASGVTQVVVENTRAYLLTAGNSTQVLDISDPAMPKHVGFVMYGGHRVAVRNSVAYYAGGSGGLVAVDVSNPQSPLFLSSILGWAGGVVVRDTVAFVATDSGLVIVDVADPRGPKILSSISTPGSRVVIDMALSGTFVYMIYGDMLAVDISDLYSPRIVSHFIFPFGQSIAAFGKEISIGDGPNGLYVLRNSFVTAAEEVAGELPWSFELKQNYPNPFNPGTTIEFYTPKEEHITLEVFATTGQRVCKLFEGELIPGRHRLFFNGSGLVSGVYFYRLVTSQGSTTRKMLIVK